MPEASSSTSQASPPRSPLRIVLLCAALGTAMPAGAAAPPVTPRIVNGVISVDFPSTGALLLVGVDGQSDALALECSATIIGCHTALVAAHCVCPDTTSTARQCRGHEADPASFALFLQHGGLFGVTAISVDPAYHFGVRGDLALLTLDAPVDGIAPSPINTTGPLTVGTSVTIAGFGITSDPLGDSGMLRFGKAVTARCADGIPDATNICWNFVNPLGAPGSDSNTCSGDSGGPLFTDDGAGAELAGVTSGGAPTCTANSFSWDTDVYSELDWITHTAGSDLTAGSCGTLPTVGEAAVQVTSASGLLTAVKPQGLTSFTVPAGTHVLRVALDGDEADPSNPSSTANDFDLYVRAGTPPTARDFDCRDLTLGTFGFCEITDPQAGTWYAAAQRFAGRGSYQLVVTTFGPHTACVGDCNGDGMVTVTELVQGVTISLGLAPLSACPSFDANGDGEVTVDELIRADNAALSGCPAS